MRAHTSCGTPQADKKAAWQRDRAGRWRAFCAEELAGDGRRLCRWVCVPMVAPSQPQTAEVASLGTLAGVEVVHDGWHTLWREPWPDGLGLAEANAPPSELPAFPAVAPLSEVELRRMAAEVPAAKVPGADGWTFKHLAGRPDALWNCVVLRPDGAARALATWAWCAHVVPLLPVGNTSDPMDQRPVLLLPMVHRLWATAWPHHAGLSA